MNKTIVESGPTAIMSSTGGTFTTVSLALPDGLLYEEWEQVGAALVTTGKGIQWWIGDWLNFGERAYGEKYSQAVQDSLSLAAQTLMHDSWVAGRFETCRRRQDLSWGHHAEVAALPPEEQDEWLDRAQANGWSVMKLREERRLEEAGNIHFSSKSDEWYTPPEIIAKVYQVMGDIDLDPCSNDADNPNVPARRHYTKDDDGLSQPWAGRVYMNPPYGKVIDDWVAKLCEEYAAERVTEAVALVPARVDTDWFRRMRDCAICFIDGRLKFSGMENSAPFPSAVVYFGSDVGRFSKGFEDAGDIWIRWEDAG